MASFRKISSTKEIAAARRGRPVRGKFMLVWRSGPEAGSDGQPPSVGVVLARGFGNAIGRNRAKRRVRGCIMDLRQRFEPGVRYLIQCRPGTEKADYQLLVNDLDDILRRAAGSS